jgi:hypothetical protein
MGLFKPKFGGPIETSTRPSSQEVTGQQLELFPFDAWEYTKNIDGGGTLIMKEAWRLIAQGGIDVTGDVVLSFQGDDPDNPVAGNSRIRINSAGLYYEVYSESSEWEIKAQVGGPTEEGVPDPNLKGFGLIHPDGTNPDSTDKYVLPEGISYNHGFIQQSGKYPQLNDGYVYYDNLDRDVLGLLPLVSVDNHLIDGLSTERVEFGSSSFMDNINYRKPLDSLEELPTNLFCSGRTISGMGNANYVKFGIGAKRYFSGPSSTEVFYNTSPSGGRSYDPLILTPPTDPDQWDGNAPLMGWIVKPYTDSSDYRMFVILITQGGGSTPTSEYAHLYEFSQSGTLTTTYDWEANDTMTVKSFGWLLDGIEEWMAGLNPDNFYRAHIARPEELSYWGQAIFTDPLTGKQYPSQEKVLGGGNLSVANVYSHVIVNGSNNFEFSLNTVRSDNNSLRLDTNAFSIDKVDPQQEIKLACVIDNISITQDSSGYAYYCEGRRWIDGVEDTVDITNLTYTNPGGVATPFIVEVWIDIEFQGGGLYDLVFGEYDPTFFNEDILIAYQEQDDKLWNSLYRLNDITVVPGPLGALNVQGAVVGADLIPVIGPAGKNGEKGDKGDPGIEVYVQETEPPFANNGDIWIEPI